MWSRSENDPSGLVELKEIEAVFVRLASVLHLHVDGQVIGTTGEHPFFAENRGWVDAQELTPDDRILTEDGRWLQVEEVYDTNEWQTVYNFTVADHHTYFVGEDGWSIWAHNSYTALRQEGLTKSQAKRANTLYKTRGELATRTYLQNQGFSGSRLDDLINAAAKSRTGAQRGPNTTSGHTATIRSEAAKLVAAGHYIIAGGCIKPEITIATPGGFKDRRRPDILYQTPSGEIRAINVGRRRANGSPVPREVRAMADLNGVYPTTFVGYN